MNSRDIILASASPRRKELLKLIFENFKVCVSDVDESLPTGISTEKAAEYLAELKAYNIARQNPDSCVIGADTIVLADKKILGKPKNPKEARLMLESLSGKAHKVITGCAAFCSGKKIAFSVSTDVEFYKLSNQEIEEYIISGEPFDKAGGYGIQSKGALFVKGIKGDYFNVVGLPVAELNRRLAEWETNS